MASERRHIDVGGAVRPKDEPGVIAPGNEDLTTPIPLAGPSKAKSKGRPVAEDDPLWSIIAMGRSEGPGNVSEHKQLHLADAYYSESR
jgi:hypothetical protein